MGKITDRKIFFKMVWNQHVEEYDLQRTIKHGLIFYCMVAMLAVPSALCSQQHRVPSHTTFGALAMGHSRPAPDALAPDRFQPQQTGLTEDARQASQDAEVSPVPEAAADDRADAPLQDEPPFYHHIMQAAATYNVDPALIRAIIVAESSSNPAAVSKRGAQGLMQLMPTTAKALGIEDSFDPGLNIDGGVRYFKRLLDRFEGNVRLALAAYNAGSRYVRKYGGVPPFRATRRYIKKVLHYQKKFQSEMVVADSRTAPSV